LDLGLGLRSKLQPELFLALSTSLHVQAPLLLLLLLLLLLKTMMMMTQLWAATRRPDLYPCCCCCCSCCGDDVCHVTRQVEDDGPLCRWPCRLQCMSRDFHVCMSRVDHV